MKGSIGTIESHGLITDFGISVGTVITGAPQLADLLFGQFEFPFRHVPIIRLLLELSIRRLADIERVQLIG